MSVLGDTTAAINARQCSREYRQRVNGVPKDGRHIPSRFKVPPHFPFTSSADTNIRLQHKDALIYIPATFHATQTGQRYSHTMTMPPRPYPGRPLAAWSVVYILLVAAGFASADDLSTTTTTVRSTTTLLTLTTTITSGQTTYATTELLTPTTTIEIPGATPSMAMGSGQGVYGGQRFEEAVLNSTNVFRQEHQASPLTWDNGLAVFGQRHAEKCIWEHSVRPCRITRTRKYKTDYNRAAHMEKTWP